MDVRAVSLPTNAFWELHGTEVVSDHRGDTFRAIFEKGGERALRLRPR